MAKTPICNSKIFEWKLIVTGNTECFRVQGTLENYWVLGLLGRTGGYMGVLGSIRGYCGVLGSKRRYCGVLWGSLGYCSILLGTAG